jgi:hypothetical protein
MRHILLLLVSFFAISLTSCRNDFEFEPSTGSLEFSKDIVYLDTVFTDISSSTYTLKVYNRSDKDISIPSIKLGRPDSKYRLMVDGMPGTSFENVELMAKDSMFVFIEVTADVADANPDDFLYTDEIQFSSINGLQTVQLVTLIQDAVFIFPNRDIETGVEETINFNGEPIPGHVLTDEELHWTNEKPYVIYGYAFVPNGSTLTVDAGARVHFHADAGLIVDRTAALQINGAPSTTEELENEVIFEGDRLEPGFAEVPGQWGAILSISESTENIINHLTLKNATVGLMLRKATVDARPRMNIHNSQIYNCSSTGISAHHAIMNSDNLVVNNCGTASVAIELGGDYHFRHATIANYFNSFSQTSLLMNDFIRSGSDTIVAQLNATFDNCIIFNSNSYAMSLNEEGDDYHTAFNNCMIKLHDFSNQLENRDLYPFSGNDDTKAAYNPATIIVENSGDDQPRFVEPAENDFHLSDDSDAINKGAASAVTVDVEGKQRPNPASAPVLPDLGAYEFYVTED